MKNPSLKHWAPCLLKRLGDMMFAVAVALLLSVAINQQTVVVHVIGHPAYVTSEDLTMLTIIVRLSLALVCLFLGCVFDSLYKGKTND